MNEHENRQRRRIIRAMRGSDFLFTFKQSVSDWAKWPLGRECCMTLNSKSHPPGGETAVGLRDNNFSALRRTYQAHLGSTHPSLVASSTVPCRLLRSTASAHGFAREAVLACKINTESLDNVGFPTGTSTHRRPIPHFI